MAPKAKENPVEKKPTTAEEKKAEKAPVAGKKPKAEKRLLKEGNASSDKKKKAKSIETYKIYIFKVLKQVHPDIGRFSTRSTSKRPPLTFTISLPLFYSLSSSQAPTTSINLCSPSRLRGVLPVVRVTAKDRGKGEWTSPAPSIVESEEEEARGHNTLSKRFRYLTKEAPYHPVRWPWHTGRRKGAALRHTQREEERGGPWTGRRRGANRGQEEKSEEEWHCGTPSEF